MIPRFLAYLFDVDGTLVDSAPDICGAIQEVLQANGHAGASEEFLRSYIGRHLVDVFQDAGCESGAIDALIAHYRHVYPQRKHGATRVYPGVIDMLRSLGGKKATATTKGTPMTRAVLDQFGLLPYFDHVQGTDGFAAKPDPAVLFASLESLDIPVEDCLFIGDSPADMEAGRRAGIATCAVRWGYGGDEEMARWEPTYWIDQPGDLG